MGKWMRSVVSARTALVALKVATASSVHYRGVDLSLWWVTGGVKTEIQAAKNLVHKPLKQLCRIPQPKGQMNKLIETEGLIMAVLGTSSGSTVMWWYAFMRSILLKKVTTPWRDAES